MKYNKSHVTQNLWLNDSNMHAQKCHKGVGVRVKQGFRQSMQQLSDITHF